MQTYLVTLKSNKYNIKFESFMKCHHISYEYMDKLNIYSIVTNEECANIIKTFVYIYIIEKNEIIIDNELNTPYEPACKIYPSISDFIQQSDEVCFNDWGVNKIKAPYYWERGFIGQGINVAVIDAGISDHDDLNIHGRVLIGDANKTMNEHGTMVAGVISKQPPYRFMNGVAYGCNLYDVNIADKNGDYPIVNIAKGIEWCIDNNINIINMSSGTKTVDVNKGLNEIYKDACRKALEKGIIIVASVGNENIRDVSLPARYPSVFGIGAVDKENKRWQDGLKGSSYGGGLNFMAPGVDIVSTYGKTNYAVTSGTSLAAPYVTGLIALILSKNPKLNFYQIRDILEYNALPLPSLVPRPSEEYGYGLVQSYNS